MDFYFLFSLNETQLVKFYSSGMQKKLVLQENKALRGMALQLSSSAIKLK